MNRRPPRSTRTDTLFPYTTLFRSDLPIVACGHAGNGNLHANILFDPDDAAQSVRAQAALPRLFALTLSLGGTLSGEHGIGVAKRNFMARAFDAPTLAAMRAVKAAFEERKSTRLNSSH